MYMYVPVYTYVCMCTHWDVAVRVYMHVYVSGCVHVRVRLRVCGHVCMCA